VTDSLDVTSTRLTTEAIPHVTLMKDPGGGEGPSAATAIEENGDVWIAGTQDAQGRGRTGLLAYVKGDQSKVNLVSTNDTDTMIAHFGNTTTVATFDDSKINMIAYSGTEHV
jgi:hypothetical protein